MTIEGLGNGNKLHPVQRAFVEEQAVQCGYCINGMIMESAAFLARQQEPDRGADQEGARQQPLPLRHPRPHRARGQARRRRSVREAAMTTHFMPSRRDMLKGGGALVVSFSLAGQIDEALAQASGGARSRSRSTEVDAFLAIDAKGAVTVYSGKVDIGTGVRTALAQMAAEELDVPLTRSPIVEGDTALTPDQGTTWGSLTIQLGGMQIRNAAATARAALLDEAAKRLGAKPEELTVADGVISGGGKRVSYGELIGGKTFSLKLDHTKPAQAKDPKDYKIVGKPVPRVDIPGKVTGTLHLHQDFRVPGMLHGRVVRPPAVGAKLESVDEGSIKEIAGVVRVVREGNFLGVVARRPNGPPSRRAQMLKATWSKWEGLPEQAKLFEHVRATKVCQRRDHRQRRQHRRGAWPRTASRSSAPPTTSPSTPTARSARPAPSPNSATASSRRGRPRRRPTSCASSSRRCSRCRSRTCAASISKAPAAMAATATRTRPPTPHCWPRRSASRCACNGRAPTSTAGIPKGPPTLIDLRAALDGVRNVTAWESEFFIPQQTPSSFMVPLVPATLAGMPADDRHRARQHLPELEHPLQVRQHQSGLPSARDDAVPAVLDQDAGADAEHLRQRVLPRRARGGGRAPTRSSSG